MRRRGALLPPYDTRTTLRRMAEAIARRAPRRIMALGDSFHDRDAAERLDDGRARGAGAAWPRRGMDLDHGQSRSRAAVLARRRDRAGAAARRPRLPPRARTVLPAGRDRGASASLHHGDAARTQPAPALLRLGWRAHGAAGLWRLCGRARSARSRDRIAVRGRVRRLSCSAPRASMQSRDAAARFTPCGGRRATRASPAPSPSARSKARRPAGCRARNRRRAAPSPSGRW